MDYFDLYDSDYRLRERETIGKIGEKIDDITEEIKTIKDEIGLKQANLKLLRAFGILSSCAVLCPKTAS